MDPALLIARFDELGTTLRIKVDRQHEALQSAAHAHATAGEQLARADHSARTHADYARADQEDAKRTRDRLRQSLAQVEECLRLLEQQSAATAEAAQRAKTCLNLWTSQHSQAQAWLQHAEAEHQRAEQQRQYCEHEFAAAQSRVDAASSALSAAQNRTVPAGKDAQGRTRYVAADTSAEQAALARAQQELSQAELELHQAEAEERAAREERDRAKAHLHQCKKALQIAQQSVSVAQQAAAQLQDARKYGADASEAARIGTAEVEAAEGFAEQALEQTEHAVTTAQQGRGTVESGSLSLQRSQVLHESTHRHAGNARLNLEHRAELLRAFDRPFNF